MSPTSHSHSFSANPHRPLRASPAALSTIGATGAAAILDATTARFYTLNDVGGRVWALLREGTTFSAIVEHLYREYDAPRGVVSADIQTLLQQLADAELLRVE